MEQYVEGEVVFVSFPFSDLSGKKKRPALILKVFEANDLLLVQITTQEAGFTRYSLVLEYKFLNHLSYIKTNKLFTVDKKIIIKKLGKVSDEKLKEIKTFISNYVKNGN